MNFTQPIFTARNSKFQAPNSKEIPKAKSKIPKSFSDLKFQIWNFLGIWNLVLGISARPSLSTPHACL
jgi:hypothetical protein